ncbi:S-4TM family putative pore-forming effector [Streptosporangium sp. NBC_01469]|uniref:S-4TM family putative pore-forming effector n=1 Tax=Streptosporangium sp. NBC_01469 TaxID=2903898 RepID=UPI003FCC9DA2
MSTPPPFTTPSISDAQNEDKQLRLLAAQRQLYTDAKKFYTVRISLLIAGSILAPIAALLFKDGRTIIGSVFTIILMLVHLLGSAKEKRLNREAASVQEQFDVAIFQLPWNDLLVERPTPTIIADAARRYSGPPTLQDWYPDTEDVHRPLDILICQRSNLGWGVSLHKLWARAVFWCLLLIAASAISIGAIGKFTVGEFLIAVIVPLVPILREGTDTFRAHSDSAQEKINTEQKVMSLWRKSLLPESSVTDAECRGLQDCLLGIRRTNAVIPNWFNDRRRDAKEIEMRTSAEDLIAEARLHRRAGKTGQPDG